MTKRWAAWRAYRCPRAGGGVTEGYQPDEGFLEVSVWLVQAGPAFERLGRWSLSRRRFRPDEPDGEQQAPRVISVAASCSSAGTRSTEGQPSVFAC